MSEALWGAGRVGTLTQLHRGPAPAAMMSPQGCGDGHPPISLPQLLPQSPPGEGAKVRITDWKSWQEIQVRVQTPPHPACSYEGRQVTNGPGQTPEGAVVCHSGVSVPRRLLNNDKRYSNEPENKGDLKFHIRDINLKGNQI